MRAFVLIRISTGEIPEVIRQLRRVKQVDNAMMTFGPYDGVVTIAANDLAELGRLIATEIQPIPGVRETLTCLGVDI